MRKFLTSIAIIVGFSHAFGQADRKDKTAVTFEELYDEPYSVNKLFIGLQPFYGELFATNVNAGFGIEASYYYKEKMDFKAHFRKTYTSKFFDLANSLASDNIPKYKNTNDQLVDMITTKPVSYIYFEAGATYHIKDFDVSSKTKMVLYKNSYKGDKWAARVPLMAEVPCKIRKIYGARLGGIYWQSSTDLSRALKDQNLSNTDLVNTEGVGLPNSYVNPITGQVDDFNVYGNIKSANVYLGGSMTWIRNVAVSFDKFEEGLDDGIMTVFLDVIYSPSLSLDKIGYFDPVTAIQSDYSTDAVKTKPIGFRLGLDGKFNRTLSWGYGGELGYRPSVSGRGFFAMFKIALPLYGTNLDYKVESFGK
jgi:hypothetical protein